MTFFEKKILFKYYYLILETKLLINRVEFFFSFRKSIDIEKLSEIFTVVDVAN